MSNPDHDVTFKIGHGAPKRMSAAEFSRLLTRKRRKKKAVRKKARRKKKAVRKKATRRKVGVRKKKRTTRRRTTATYGRGKKCKRRKKATCKRVKSAGKRMSKGKTASARSRAAKVVSCSRLRKKRCRKTTTMG